MSINVNNLSKADLVKLAMNKQSGKTTAANQPSYMTKNGSIFNAPNAKQTAQTKESKPTTLSEGIDKLNNTKNSQEAKSYDNIDNIKTAEQGRKAIADLKEDMQDMSPLQRALQRVPLQLKLNKLEEKQKDLAKQEFEDSQANLKSIAQGNGAIDKDGTSTKSTTSKDGGNVSAEEGKAMANDAESENAKLEKQTAQTEKDAQEVEGYQKDAKKTQKDIKKDEAKFNKEIAKESKTISKNQAEMAKESEQMTQTRTEIDALQAELQSLTADSTGMGERSAFSLKLAGDNSQQTNGGSNSNSTSGMDDTNSRVAELQAQIGEKADTMQVRGQKLQKLQTSTNKSITVMHNKVRLKSIYYTKAQKTMETEQKTTDKIMKVADKIDNISQTVTQVGKTLQYVGKGMIIAGKALASNPFTAAAGAALITAGGFTQKTGTVTELVGNYGSAAANITKTACNVADGNFAAALQTAGCAIQSGAAAAKGTQGLKDNMKAIDASVEQAQTEAAVSVQAKEAAKQMKENGTLGDMTEKEAAKTMKGNMMNEVNKGNLELRDGKLTMTDKAAPKMGADGKFHTDFMADSKPVGEAGAQAGKTSIGQKVKKGINNAGQQIKKAAKDPDTLAKLGKQMTALGAKMAGGTQQTQQAGRSKANNYTYPNIQWNNKRLANGYRLMNMR